MRPSPKLRVFLDSNVILSGLHSSAGAPGIILERFIEGELMVVISQQVLEEVVRTINEKLPGALPTLKRLLVSIIPEIVKDPSPQEVTPWAEIIHPDDAGILTAAVAAQPDYLITGDKHFFENPSIAGKSGLHIVTPAQFLECLKSTELPNRSVPARGGEKGASLD
ncbi:MAG: putative toxin-antitoxin system toxin component, PIN family [Chloroflexi bacterium]|nr:putative toxin-antitoxin system toxin component, PIN family [Chloroflexota bacterium]